MGENTYPNLLALLSGVHKSRNIKWRGNFFYLKIDNTLHDNFRWNEYEKLGYLTAFNQKFPAWPFHYQKHSFKYKPAHLYYNPYWKIYNKIRSNLCLNYKPAYKTSLNTLKDCMEKWTIIQIHKRLIFHSIFLSFTLMIIQQCPNCMTKVLDLL